MVDFDIKLLSPDATSPENKVSQVGIVGGTGYTGVELLRIPAVHPVVVVSCITSRSEAGMPVADMYPNLPGPFAPPFLGPDHAVLASVYLVSFSPPPRL